MKLPAAVFINGLVNAGKICLNGQCFAKALSPGRSPASGIIFAPHELIKILYDH